MKMVCEGREWATPISFRLWRKFAARERLRYESWEEGQVVRLLEKFDPRLKLRLK